MNRRLWPALRASLVLPALCILASAEGWPTYRHDPARSGVASDPLTFPLTDVWVHHSPHPPRPAWPAPAKQDFWHEHHGLQPEAAFDRAYHVVVSGGRVLYGSSADDKVYCLDADAGNVLWTHCTGGPVRLAPTVAADRVYVGSDDGCVCCLRLADGQLLWRQRVAPRDRRVPGNGRMISVWPVRTGVALADGLAYCCAGLFPGEGVYVCALGAGDGRIAWRRETDRVSPQGYLLVADQQLLVPTGRTAPAVFDRSDGKYLSSFSTRGGAFAVLADDVLVSGPGRTTGLVDLADPQTRATLASFKGLRLVMRGGAAFIHTGEALQALDARTYLALLREGTELQQRGKAAAGKLAEAETSSKTAEVVQLQAEKAKLDRRLAELPAAREKCFLWEKKCPHRDSLILAGDVLIAGGDDTVAAFRATDGQQVWTGQVRGRACGLAAAEAKLFVSTDEGAIHCFGAPGGTGLVEPPARPRERLLRRDSEALFARAAQRIVAETGVTKGYCLDLGCGDGSLAVELTRLTDLRIIGVEEDAEDVRAARAALDARGLYGVRVTLDEGPLDRLPYADHFANLVVSGRAVAGGGLPGDPGEIWRVLRPQGGSAFLGQPETAAGAPRLTEVETTNWLGTAPRGAWQLRHGGGVWLAARRGALPGSGDWTHLYADAGNSACSADALRAPLQLQWFGRPGPRNMVDRHHRAPGALATRGRLIVPGNNRVTAVDAYNGTPLWEVELPGSRRIGAPKDAGQVVARHDAVYVAAGAQCMVLDPKTGRTKRAIDTPRLPGRAQLEWGYLASDGLFLVGTGAKQGASRTGHSKGAIEGAYYDAKPVVTSVCLFVANRHTGRRLWTYFRKEGSVLLNSALALGNGAVYFIESRNPAAVADADGRVALEVLLAQGQAHLVKLRCSTGEKLWERPLALSELRHVLFLSYARGALVAVGSRNEGGHPRYDLHAFSAADGSPLWTNHYVRTDKPAGGSHGEQDQHPVIVGETIYSRPYAFDLRTGEQVEFALDRAGHGCGALSGSDHYLYGRGGNPQAYPLAEGGKASVPLTRATRPGCWVNIVPAGGLVLLPESSSGCTCAYPLQTSLALAPRPPTALVSPR